MKIMIRNTLGAFLAFFALASCKQETEVPVKTPPIQLKVVSAAVAKQLGDGLGDSFVKVGNTTFDNLSSDSAQDCYHVEVFYKVAEVEKREVLTLISSTQGDSDLLKFTGSLPIPSSDNETEAKKVITVTIDELTAK